MPELTSSDIVVVPGTAGRLSERRPVQAPTLGRLRSHHEAGGRRQRHRPGAASGRPGARAGRGRQSRALPVVYARRNGADPQISAALRHRNHVEDVVHRAQDVVDAHYAEASGSRT
ncbi:MAG TPA: hypothetical protein VEX15_21440 [Nocardioidaceae bacterium]|nr:hypothetical protein [Nocardioidaceae bacterium]